MKYRVHTRTYWPCLRPMTGQSAALFDIADAMAYIRVISAQDAQAGIGADYWLVPVWAP